MLVFHPADKEKVLGELQWFLRQEHLSGNAEFILAKSIQAHDLKVNHFKTSSFLVGRKDSAVDAQNTGYRATSNPTWERLVKDSGGKIPSNLGIKYLNELDGTIASCGSDLRLG